MQAKIVIQHHGELPWKGLKGFIQKLSTTVVDSFLFTAEGNAKPWKEKKIIRSGHKLYEVLEASTSFIGQDKKISKAKLGMTEALNFLWVGRLVPGKDPITILSAFANYQVLNPEARLFMIFQEGELLADIKSLINSNHLLRGSVILVGKIEHNELPYWYSAADFYLSGSHKEGSGYALLEAIACDCIPIVSDIPSYRVITWNGQYGALFTPGNVNELTRILFELSDLVSSLKAKSQSDHFKNHLSFQAIGRKISSVC